MLLRYSLAWILMVFIAIGNGALRETLFARVLSELRAHQLSCATGILLFALYTWFLSLIWPLASRGQALEIGFVWLCLTVAFEFVFGRYVFHQPWAKLLHDYDVLAGRLWVLVLLAVALLPALIFELSA